MIVLHRWPMWNDLAMVGDGGHADALDASANPGRNVHTPVASSSFRWPPSRMPRDAGHQSKIPGRLSRERNAFSAILRLEAGLQTAAERTDSTCCGQAQYRVGDGDPRPSHVDFAGSMGTGHCKCSIRTRHNEFTYRLVWPHSRPVSTHRISQYVFS